MGNIMLNGISYTGGSKVSYGTSAPTASMGSDGALYIQIDSQQIVDIWINVNGDWLPFTGTPTLALVYSSRDRNTSDTKTYTATKKCRLLGANINVNGEASNRTLQSNITTTGTVVETWYHDSEWSDPNRNHTMRWSIIDVDPGDTVSMETQTNGGFTNQIRAVWEIANINLSGTITNKAISIQSDGNLPTSNTYTPSVDGTYLIWAVKTSGAGNSFSTSDISVLTTPSTELESNVFDASGDGLLSIAIVKNPTSLEADISSSSDYCSRGYGVLRL